MENPQNKGVKMKWKKVTTIEPTGAARRILAEQDVRRNLEDPQALRPATKAEIARMRKSRKASVAKARKEGLATGSLKGPRK
tara:strand:+ start:369 stop:614 length:246 start_codon:yes stop_codon:yes gene_type:complete